MIRKLINYNGRYTIRSYCSVFLSKLLSVGERGFTIVVRLCSSGNELNGLRIRKL